MSASSVIDIGRIGLQVEEPTPDDLLGVGCSIVDAFSTIGFIYLSNHGVSQQLQEDTFSVAKQFFDLEPNQKLAYERFVKTGYSGYTPIDGDTLGKLASAGGETPSEEASQASVVTEYKESYDLRSFEDPGPDSVAPRLQPQLERAGSVCRQLSERLLAALDAALGGQQLASWHRRQLQAGGWTVLRLTHYPAVPAAAAGRQLTRCGAHRDFSTLTLIFQRSVGGLEVETSEGEWVAAEPIPGMILAIVGDVIEVATGGRLRSANHRVPLPCTEQARNTARQSMMFFVQPDEGTIVEPPSGDLRYEPMDISKLYREKFDLVYPAFHRFNEEADNDETKTNADPLSSI